MPRAARAALLIVAAHALVLGVLGRTPPGPLLSNLSMIAAGLARGRVLLAGGRPQLRLQPLGVAARRDRARHLERRPDQLDRHRERAAGLGPGAFADTPAVPPLRSAAARGAAARRGPGRGDPARLGPGAGLRPGRDRVPVLLLRRLLRAAGARDEPGEPAGRGLSRHLRHRELADRRGLRAAGGPGPHARGAARLLADGALRGRLCDRVDDLQLRLLPPAGPHRAVVRPALDHGTRRRDRRRVRLAAARRGREVHSGECRAGAHGRLGAGDGPDRGPGAGAAGGPLRAGAGVHRGAGLGLGLRRAAAGRAVPAGAGARGAARERGALRAARRAVAGRDRRLRGRTHQLRQPGGRAARGSDQPAGPGRTPGGGLRDPRDADGDARAPRRLPDGLAGRGARGAPAGRVGAERRSRVPAAAARRRGLPGAERPGGPGGRPRRHREAARRDGA